MVHNDDLIEIEYERADRATLAPTAVKLINTRVNFQWWVKSNEHAKDGNQFLGGWEATNGMVTNSRGLATYTGTLTESQMAAAIEGRPARYTVSLDSDQADSVDMREKWTQSSSLSHAHTGLENPATNTMANNDKGAIYVTWQTHALVLGVYREADDVEGFTNYQSRLPGGDHRPVSSVAGEMKITALAKDSRGRDKPYEYDHDACTSTTSGKTDPREPVFTIRDGLARVTCLPRNDEFTIKFELGDDRVEVGIVAEQLHGYIEPFNEDDLTVNPDGSTVGTFGDGSGGVPEVRLCLSSAGTTDEECATWGYQWTTGSVVGNVGTQRGHRVFIDPMTENHGADTTSTSSGTDGVYDIDELQDGVYNITAYSTSTYRIRGDSVEEVLVYHDETTDDDDTLTEYVGTAAQDTARWSTQQLGLEVAGYIGNDVNRDDKFRGDESVAGITVRLSGGGVSMSTTTDERGFYMFEDVPSGSYTVTPSTSTYLVVRGYRTLSGGRRSAYTNWRATAQDYPTLTEGEFDLPYWTSYTSRSLSNSSERVCDDSDPPNCATLYNFGLLYKDGEVEGAVNNLSGSSSGIDLIWTDVFTDGKQEITTNFRGEFTRTSLTEGDFTIELEDAGWASPKMRGSEPDDDGTTTAPSTVSASLRGKDDFEDMVLHVYDAGASSGDFAGSTVRVRGSWQGTNAENFDSAVSWPTGWSRATDTEETAGGNIGTISWNSESVSFYFGFRNSALSDDATVEVKKGSTVCAGHRCTLDYNRTGSTDEGEDKANTLTATVTAENGYDDHEYSLMVSRAAPIGNEMTTADFLRVDVVDGEDEETPALGDGDGKSVHDAFTMETKNATGSSLTMRIDLTVLGMAGESNAHCAQSAMVQEYNDADTVKSLNPEVEAGENDPYEDDVCRDTRYRLSVPELYEIEIKSEDGVAETYYVSTRNRDRSGNAELFSLEIDGDDINLVSGDTTYSAVEAADTVTVEWETEDPNASVRVTPSDTDSGEDGHQFALGEPNEVDTLTIRVVSEDREDTLHYVLDIQQANNVATLASLSPINDDETFDAATTSYTYDVGHDVSSVTFTFGATDTDASTDPTSPHAATLGDAGTDTDVDITVTAEDGSTTETYTVTVTRAATPPDPTAGIVLMEDDAPFSEDMTEGETDTIMASLATEPTADSTVTVTVTVETGLTLVSAATLTFNDGTNDWNVGQEVVVTAADDDDAEPNDADLQFTFQGDTLTGYHGGLGDTINVAFIETDTKGVNLSATAKEVNEGATPGTYTIVLNSQPVGGNVNIELSGKPDDVTLSATQFEFTSTDWSTAQTVTITPTNDTDTASHSAFDLSHDVLGGGYTGMDVDDVTVQILDDEAPQVVITTTAVTVNEGGTFAYNIALTQAPSGGETVTVDLAFNTGELTATVTSVELTSANYEAGVAVTITAKNVSADATRMIEHNVSVADTDDSDDQVYDGTESASSITVTVKDVPSS